MKRIVCLLTLLILAPSPFANGDSLSARLRSFQMEFKDRALPPLPQDRLAIFGVVTPADSSFNEFQTALIRERLKRANLPADMNNREIEKALPSGARAEDPNWDTLLIPKLIVETSIRESESPGYSDVVSHLSYIIYVIDGSTIRPRLEFDRLMHLQNVKLEDIRERVAIFLRTEVTALAPKINLEKKAKRDAVPYKGSLAWSPIPPEPSQLERLESPTRESSHTALELGISIGTPAWVQPNAGVWGILDQPIAAGISGMYWGPGTRGFTAHAGWIFDREGEFEQSAGLALTFLNEATRSSRPNLDAAGQLISTELTTSHRLIPYVGPEYAIRWHSFKFSAGIGVRLGESGGNSVMPVVQFGWLPLLHL